jgi:hypothetical protein
MIPETNLLAKSGQLYRMQIAVSPLLAREVSIVVAAFAKQWARPESIERAGSRGALVLGASAEGHLRPGERHEDVARAITYTIWRVLGRYVKVTVEATYLGESPNASFEYGEKAYAEAYGARFET